MVTAFVLLNIDLGKDEDVLSKLRKIEGVKKAYQVYGVYDVVAKLEAESAEGLRAMLQEKVRKLDDIRSTLTLMAA